MIWIALLWLSTVTPPPPTLPEVNQGFDCRVFAGEGGPPFHIRGSARTLPQLPKTIWDPVEVRLVSESPDFPSLEETVQVMVVSRGMVIVEHERDPERRLVYHLLINDQSPNGALLISEWSIGRPSKYVATGLCELQPLEVSP